MNALLIHQKAILLLLVFTYVISKFKSIKKQISIPKCLWNCRKFKTTPELHISAGISAKFFSARAFRSRVTGERVLVTRICYTGFCLTQWNDIKITYLGHLEFHDWLCNDADGKIRRPNCLRMTHSGTHKRH